MSEALDRDLRKELAKAVRAARQVAEDGARAALGALGVGAAQVDPSLPPEDRALRRRLRAHGRALGDRRQGDGQETTRLAHEVAYEHWHRMLFARFLAENNLLIDPESGAAVSLDECRDLARERNEEPWAMVGGFAERMLPRIFRPDDPALTVRLAPEVQQALEKTLADLPSAVFRSDDSLGWTYQFWQTDRKDDVNRSGVKIGADELPAVTQLFTERYMVRFLFHNTLGAWRAEKVLAVRYELADAADGEAALRRAVRLKPAGGYTFDYLRFVRESREDQEHTDHPGRWRPASGSFAEWPRRAADLKVLDPCCGSGHFLVEGLHLFVRLRMAEENLALKDAVRAVLRDNLHGLEIDPRCAQIAAFSVAFAAWKLVGRAIELPPLNIACSGLAPNATKEEWSLLAERTAATVGSAPSKDLFETRETLQSNALRQTFGALHDLFAEAPTRGSLIDPRAAGASMFAAGFETVRPLVDSVLQQREPDPDRVERTVAAAGMVRAASLLAGTYSLVTTNVPYLVRGRQGATLRAFAAKNYPASRRDLATMFVERALAWLGNHGTQAMVVPQKWLFLTRYRRLREDLLSQRRFRFVARLGPGAFDTIGGHVVNVALTMISPCAPTDEWRMTDLDVSAPTGKTSILADEKAARLSGAYRGIPHNSDSIQVVRQSDQRKNPDSIILSKPVGDAFSLREVASSYHGISTKDYARFGRCFWEFSRIQTPWVFQQSTVQRDVQFGGLEHVLLWEEGRGELNRLRQSGTAVVITGLRAWNRQGVAVSQTGELRASNYLGTAFDDNTAVIVSKNAEHHAAVVSFCFSPDYAEAVRKLDTSLKVTYPTLVKVPFDVGHWKAQAEKSYPTGPPEPYSDDPTQWIFHGHPCDSVVWDSAAKRTAEGPTRTDTTVLHVAVARLLGYRWPAERDHDMRLADEARALVAQCEPFVPSADQDGIVCLPAVRQEGAAADRLRSLLAAAYGDAWSATTEQRLLQEAGTGAKPAASLDDWLRNHFFTEHCRLFHQLPFVWHIWDGLPDGFSVLVNYHRLAGPDGEGRRTLESLTYSYLGDWIARQRAAQYAEEPGADARLAAALELKTQLELILAGEPPLDLFVRWKPLHDQSIGWEPDINDGVRLNIRPFLRAELRQGGRKGAGILRAKPNIKWTKDRGKEPQDLKPKHKGEEPRAYRPKADFPWFWSCPGGGTEQERTDFPGGPTFDGARWNDLHYTTATKHSARKRCAPRLDADSAPETSASAATEQ